MRIEAVVCDRCGKKLDNHQVNKIEVFKNGVPYSTGDFCETCAKLFDKAFEPKKKWVKKSAKIGTVPTPEQVVATIKEKAATDVKK